jgi:hypothetical protein
LLENNSDQLFAASKEGGVILRVCVASATFCSRLERKALATDGGEQWRKAIVGAQHDSTMEDVQQSEPGKHNVPTSQPADQNLLRDVILQKKARIVKIECTLDRPQEEASRLRLGEEREDLVLEVEELEAELREALVDRAIASRKRMESSVMPEGSRHANPSALDAKKSRALLGIDLSDLENLRREVRRRFFFDEARLPRAMEVEWEETLSSREVPDSHVDLALTFALTKEYVKAISRASRQLVDLLATAAVSRIGQADFREAIWRECLDFAYQLGQWDAFASWVDRVAGIRWKAPVTADATTDLEQLEKAAKPRREFFENRIGMYSQEWLSAIDQAIELRLTVSAPRTVNTSGEIEKKAPGIASAPSRIVPTPSKKCDPEVAKRRALVKSNAGVPVLELCQIFDRENVPLPVKWQAAGLKTWVEAHRKYATRVKVIVSKDRSSD